MSGPSSSFPAFLQARVSNTYVNSPRLPHHQHHHQHHQLRLFHHPNIRPMATQQDADVYGFDAPDVNCGNDDFDSTHNAQPYNSNTSMSISRMQTFEEMSRNESSVVSALTNVSQWQEMQQASQGRLPFRPTLPGPVEAPFESSSGMNFRSDNMSLGGSCDGMNTSFSGSIDNSYAGVNTSFANPANVQPLKIDTTLAAATPPLSVLSTPVDAAQYELVQDTEWMWSSTAYASSTRSSVRTESTGPRTPLSPHAADSAHSSYFSSCYQDSPDVGAVSKVEGAGPDMFPSTLPRSLLMNCSCADCVGPVAPQQLSALWSFNHSQASYLGSHPAYGSTAPSTITLPFDFSNQGQSQTIDAPFVPRQTSPPATSSLVDLERHSADITDGESEGSESESDEPNVNDQAVNDATHRQKRDSFLLNMRRQNYSYKDIKELGNFREAESTLRGRVRVLTKDKSERVRKPEWNSNDIDLLDRAFERYAGFDDDGEAKPRRRELPSRIPWKKISGWMKSHGSSYPFAPATCARKWKALN